MRASIICSRAAGISKGGPGMVGLAGQYLNLVLEDLVLNRDLKMNRVTTIITASSGVYGPFALEADYLRTYDLFYQIPGVGGSTASSQTLFLNPITMEQFDAEFKSPTQTNYPYEWASDTSTDAQVWTGGDAGAGTKTSAGGLYIYPASSGSLNLTHRYMKQQAPLATPDQSQFEPWFPYSLYLITATAAHMMGEMGDARAAEYFAKAEEMLRPYLIMTGDEQATVRNVKLDPRHFRFSRGLKPTKAMPYLIGAMTIGALLADFGKSFVM